MIVDILAVFIDGSHPEIALPDDLGTLTYPPLGTGVKTPASEIRLVGQDDDVRAGAAFEDMSAEAVDKGLGSWDGALAQPEGDFETLF